MNQIELQEQITQELSKISYDDLKLIAEFVEFIKQKKSQTSLEIINYRPASGGSILRHVGQWKGDDLEDCLKLMYETKGQVAVDRRINPFE